MSLRVKETELQIWQKIIGDCVKFRAERNRISLILKVYGQNMRITFKRDSKEGVILERLGKRLVGQKLGVLRTDSEAEPIVIRLIPKEEPRP
jgi:hypothetical protein